MNKEEKHAEDTCEIFCYDEAKVMRVRSVVEDVKLTTAANIFKALADQTRLKIAYALLKEDELCVCDVANIIDASTATTSHHLRHLRKLGIARSRKEGKLVFYALDDEHVKMLVTTAVVHGNEVDNRE